MSIPRPRFKWLPDHTPLLVYRPIFLCIFGEILQEWLRPERIDSFKQKFSHQILYMESTINSQECPKNSRKYCNYSWAVTVKTGEQPWQHIHQSTFLTVNNQDPENWTEQVNEWSVYYIQETWRSTKQQYTYFMRRTVSVYDKSNLLGSPCEIFMLCFPISINFFYTCFLNCFIH